MGIACFHLFYEFFSARRIVRKMESVKAENCNLYIGHTATLGHTCTDNVRELQWVYDIVELKVKIVT